MQAAPQKPSQALASYHNYRTKSQDRSLKLHRHRYKLKDHMTDAQLLSISSKRALTVESAFKQGLKSQKTLNILRQLSAVLIQSHIRGFLARLKTDPVVVSRRRLAYSDHEALLAQHLSICQLRVGASITQSALKIGRSVRTYLFRRKLLRLARGYNWHTKAIRSRAKEFLRRALGSLLSAQVVRRLRYEKAMSRRLQEIRRRLAVLAVQKTWRLNGLSFQTMVQRLKRNKRRKFLLSTNMPEEQLEKNEAQKPESSFVKTNSSIDSMVKYELPQQQYKLYKRNRSVARQAKLEKIKKGKLSYGISKPRAYAIEPIRRQIRVSAGRSVNYGEVSEERLPASTNTYELTGHFLQATLSYMNRVHQPRPRPQRKIRVGRCAEGLHILKPTISTALKTNERSRSVTPSLYWRPVCKPGYLENYREVGKLRALERDSSRYY